MFSFFRVFQLNFECISHICHTKIKSPPPHPPWLYHSNKHLVWSRCFSLIWMKWRYRTIENTVYNLLSWTARKRGEVFSNCLHDEDNHDQREMALMCAKTAHKILSPLNTHAYLWSIPLKHFNTLKYLRRLFLMYEYKTKIFFLIHGNMPFSFNIRKWLVFNVTFIWISVMKNKQLVPQAVRYMKF
jgi:hypothetical protein